MAHNSWNNDEINLIKENYKTMSDEELHKIIPRHSVSSIITKRKDIGLKRPSGNKKYTFDDVLKIINERGYKLLSTKLDFNNAGSILKYICPKHDNYIQETTLGRLLEGKGYMYCGRERTINNKILTTDQCISLCQKKGFKFVENKIINNKTVIFFICPKHECVGVQQMTY